MTTISNPEVRRRLEELTADFRREVNDKIAVVYHGANNPMRGQREVVMKQCEDFLVEQFESGLAAVLALPEAPAESYEQQIRSRIAELEEKHGTAESCGWHPDLTYLYDMEVAAALNELKRLLTSK